MTHVYIAIAIIFVAIMLVSFWPEKKSPKPIPEKKKDMPESESAVLKPEVKVTLETAELKPTEPIAAKQPAATHAPTLRCACGKPATNLTIIFAGDKKERILNAFCEDHAKHIKYYKPKLHITTNHFFSRKDGNYIKWYECSCEKTQSHEEGIT